MTDVHEQTPTLISSIADFNSHEVFIRSVPEHAFFIEGDESLFAGYDRANAAEDDCPVCRAQNDTRLKTGDQAS